MGSSASSAATWTTNPKAKSGTFSATAIAGMIQNFRKGEKHGTWTEWNEEGKVLSVRKFDRGVAID